jgi:hypothetical protein
VNNKANFRKKEEGKPRVMVISAIAATWQVEVGESQV